jgi:inhibitor of KinA sporulation pathway (predicted exonuclease)
MSILIVTDLECTCDETTETYTSIIPRDRMEVIEIGSVAYDTTTKTIIEEFQAFVRPVEYPTLTKFCTKLTTIRQDMVDNEDIFEVVYPKFEQFMSKYANSKFACYGNFDFNHLQKECNRKNVKFSIKNHINVSHEIVKYFNLKKKVGTWKALQLAGLKFEGTQHRGIDDARNIAKLVEYMGIE